MISAVSSNKLRWLHPSHPIDKQSKDSSSAQPLRAYKIAGVLPWIIHAVLFLRKQFYIEYPINKNLGFVFLTDDSTITKTV
jgi:hypothetical protein